MAGAWDSNATQTWLSKGAEGSKTLEKWKGTMGERVVWGTCCNCVPAAGAVGKRGPASSSGKAGWLCRQGRRCEAEHRLLPVWVKAGTWGQPKKPGLKSSELDVSAQVTCSLLWLTASARCGAIVLHYSWPQAGQWKPWWKKGGGRIAKGIEVRRHPISSLRDC